MALIVEDGSNVPNANSYQSIADITALVANTPYADEWDASEDQELYAAGAAAYIDLRFRSYGDVLFDDQSMQWPRTKNYDSKGVIIPAGTIPKELKQAQAYLAAYFAANPDEFEEIFDGSVQMKSWSTDGLAITFDSSTNSKGETTESAMEQVLGTRYPQVELILRPIATRKDANWLGPNKQSVVKS